MKKISERVQKMNKEIIRRIKSKKGGTELIIFLVLVAVVSLLAVNTLPGMMTKVKAQGDGANTRIDALADIFK